MKKGKFIMIRFTDDLATHFPMIDQQHKELFDRINSVVSMGAASVNKEETEKTIRLLGDYIIKHFSDEEALQRKYNYPKIEHHRAQHRIYIAEFNRLKAEYAQNGPSANFTLTMNNSIIQWIVRHIKTEDQDLGNYLKKHM